MLDICDIVCRILAAGLFIHLLMCYVSLIFNTKHPYCYCTALCFVEHPTSIFFVPKG